MEREAELRAGDDSILAYDIFGALLAVAGLMAAGTAALARGDDDDFRATLTGFQEVPAISTTGHGRFTAELEGGSTLSYELRYAGLEGGTAVAEHIHLGQRSVDGGVSAFLCGGGG